MTRCDNFAGEAPGLELRLHGGLPKGCLAGARSNPATAANRIALAASKLAFRDEVDAAGGAHLRSNLRYHETRSTLQILKQFGLRAVDVANANILVAHNDGPVDKLRDQLTPDGRQFSTH